MLYTLPKVKGSLTTAFQSDHLVEGCHLSCSLPVVAFTEGAIVLEEKNDDLVFM